LVWLRTHKSVRQHDVATENIAEVSQPLFERLRQICSPLGRGHDHAAYTPDFPGLLSFGGAGSRQGSAYNYADEISPLHSITSGAWVTRREL
jgi:hypothetical protein